jgi:hypothetical protein
MTWKVLIAAGVVTMQAGGLMMGTMAHGQAPASGWMAHAAPVVLPVEPSAPRGGDFTPPAPRGDLRGDIAANSKDSRRDRSAPPDRHKQPPR